MFNDTPLHMVEDAAGVRRLADVLNRAPVIAVDTESNSMYAHTERVCLIQFTAGDADWIVDPLAVDDISALGEALADPDKPTILHGADYDVRCLRRDFDFEIRNMFDTLIAAQLLALPRVGLGDLLTRFFGVEVDKQFQRYNWALRPLRGEHLDYARGDTHFLHALREILIHRLRRAGRLEHHREECEILQSLKFEPRPFDPDDALEMKGSKILDDTGLRVLRRLYVFREKEAARTNRPTYKVIPNQTLIALADKRPEDDHGLGKILSPRSAIRRKYGERILDEIDDGCEEDWPIPKRKKKKPAPKRVGPPARLRGRSAERAMEALKAWRNALTKSDPRHTSHNVISNSSLKVVAAVRPHNLDELAAIPEVRNWQVQEFGDQLLSVLDKVDPQG